MLQTNPFNQHNLVITFPYVLFPLSQIISETIGKEITRNWIDLAWLLLTLAAVATFRIKRNPPNIASFVGTLLLAILALSISYVSVLNWQFNPALLLLNTKILIYLLVALVIFNSRINPTKAAFCIGGAALSILIISEFIVKSLIKMQMERPFGSGEINYDAALILLSLILSLTEPTLRRRYTTILLVGLVCTFSRTGLVSAIIVVLLSSSTSKLTKAGFLLIASFSIIYSFLLRDLVIGDLAAMDRYWMWKSSFEYFLENPLRTAIIVPDSSPLEIEVPNELASLWQEQADKLNLEGVHPFHLHAFWLRLATTWGWLLPSIILGFTAYQVVRRRPENGLQMYLVAFTLLGSTMGLLYLSNVAVPYYLAGFLLLPTTASRLSEQDRTMLQAEHRKRYNSDITG